MKAFLFETSLMIGVFYLFYFLILRKEPHFQLNRFYLLTTMFLSFLLPLIPEIPLNNTRLAAAVILPETGVTASSPEMAPTKTLDLISPWMIIYLTGVTWFFLRYLINLLKITYLFRRFPKTTVNGLRTVVMNGDRSPFTFFNILFIAESDLKGNKSAEIIEHEMAHVRQYHTLDCLVTELAVIFLWFNPFIWFFSNALKTGHEYAADRRVLNEGYNVVSYQNLLLARTLGVEMINLANHLNYSILKNRLVMMTNNKSKRLSGLRYALVLPLLFLVLACTLADGRKSLVQDDKVYDEVELMPEFPGGMMALRQHLAQNLIYPDLAMNSGVTGKVYIQFVVNKKGAVQDAVVLRSDINETKENEIVVVGYTPEKLAGASQKDAIRSLEQEAIRVINTLPDFKPGSNKGKPVMVRYTIPIQFSLQ
ncbi:MAG: M56 family metallopeptidase [Bacteroidales bacterium]|nr:M56 family metallopeptidase [Bacteroidales bacterium]